MFGLSRDQLGNDCLPPPSSRYRIRVLGSRTAGWEEGSESAHRIRTCTSWTPLQKLVIVCRILFAGIFAANDVRLYEEPSWSGTHDLEDSPSGSDVALRAHSF